MSSSVAATTIAEKVRPWVSVVFAAAIIYQILHWIEHVAQTYQHAWLGIPGQEAHGILFFFDTEWNHFAFNTLFWAALLGVVVGLGFWRKRSDRSPSAPFIVFAVGLFVETYHEIEHLFKISQHAIFDCQSCPGLLGNYLDVVYYHFTLNSIVLFSALYAFIAWGFIRRVWRYA